jgi:hypothetical protein
MIESRLSASAHTGTLRKNSKGLQKFYKTQAACGEFSVSAEGDNNPSQDFLGYFVDPLPTAAVALNSLTDKLIGQKKLHFSFLSADRYLI